MLHLQANPEVDIEQFCDQYLNMKRATPFSVMSAMYYEIKRCVPLDKRLLIQRCDPDVGFPLGSAVLVDTGRELVRVSWAMMRSIIAHTLDSVSKQLDSIKLPGQVFDSHVLFHFLYNGTLNNATDNINFIFIGSHFG